MATTFTLKSKKRASGGRKLRANKQLKIWSYSKDYDRFHGEYIAFEGDRIVAHGTDARKVLAKARTLVKSPFVEKVLPRRLLY